MKNTKRKILDINNANKKLGEYDFFDVTYGIKFINDYAISILDYDLNNLFARVKLYIWWEVFGKKQNKFLEWYLTDKEKDWLIKTDLTEFFDKEILFFLLHLTNNDNYLATTESLNKIQLSGLPLFLEILMEFRMDLKETFFNEPSSFLKWYNEGGCIEYPLMIDEICYIEKEISINKTRQLREVNLVAMHSLIAGIGEDAKLVCAALEKAGLSVKKYAPSFLKDIDKDFKNLITFYVIPPIEFVRHINNLHKEHINTLNSYNIGIMPWELDVWPNEYNFYFNSLDEIWSPSQFCYDVFSKVHNNVKLIKYPVEFNLPFLFDRKFFNLPENLVLYLLVFDLNSWIARKNPELAIKAFNKLSEEFSDIGLVIKMINFDINRDGKLLQLIENKENIFVFNMIMEKEVLNGLISVCDFFLSVHRSEGFGRVIAEAMLLDTMVIVSNYSGNLDFCMKDSCFLIDGEKVAVGQKEYPLYKNSKWYEPSFSNCVQQMKLAYESRNDINNKKINNKRNILEQYSILKVSEVYRIQLERIINDK